ncbi:MAG TPA: GGDEF domain-containing protein [Anaerolineales bacterium]|nr:GGDEF domain-containing protein [Anaerolineales bacterium]
MDTLELEFSDAGTRDKSAGERQDFESQLTDLILHFAQIDSDINGALTLAQTAMREALLTANRNLENLALIVEAICFYNTSNRLHAYQALSRALAQREADAPFHVRALFYLGKIRAEMANFLSSIEIFQQAHSIAVRFADFEGEGLALLGLSMAYSELEMYSRAHEQLEELSELYHDTPYVYLYDWILFWKEQNYLTWVLNEPDIVPLAQLHVKMESAILRLRMLIERAKRNQNHLLHGQALELYARVYLATKQFSHASQLFYEMLYLARQLPNNRLETGALYGLGETYLHQEAYTIAVDYLSQAHQTNGELQNQRIQTAIYFGLSKVYEAHANPIEALAYYKKFQQNERDYLAHLFHQHLQVVALEFEIEKNKQQAELFHLRTEELKRKNEALERKAASLQKEAHIDALTGLANRRLIDRKLHDWVESPQTMNLLVIAIDIDHFKQINDSFSHPVGDSVLQETANLLRRSSRPNDLLGRYGGDELIIVCRNIDPLYAHKICERVRSAIQNHAWQTIAPFLKVTASLGYSLISPPTTAKEGIAQADKQLYLAKQNGRNQVSPMGII